MCYTSVCLYLPQSERGKKCLKKNREHYTGVCLYLHIILVFACFLHSLAEKGDLRGKTAISIIVYTGVCLYLHIILVFACTFTLYWCLPVPSHYTGVCLLLTQTG